MELLALFPLLVAVVVAILWKPRPRKIKSFTFSIRLDAWGIPRFSDVTDTALDAQGEGAYNRDDGAVK